MLERIQSLSDRAKQETNPEILRSIALSATDGWRAEYLRHKADAEVYRNAESESNKIIEQQRQTIEEQATRITRLEALKDLQADELFGQSSERSSSLLSSNEEDKNPLDEDAEDTTTTDETTFDESLIPPTPSFSMPKEKRKKQKGKRASALDRLAREIICFFEEADTEFPDGWRMAGVEPVDSVELIPERLRRVTRVYPVFSVLRKDPVTGGTYWSIVRPKRTLPLIPKSLATPSLLAALMANKYYMGLPYHRQAENMECLKILGLSKQTIQDWTNSVAHNILKPVYDYLQKMLLKQQYHQVDETTWPVINDKKKKGIKGYMWEHRTSSTAPGPHIILIAYESTRSSDHLLSFYAKATDRLYLTSDAYVAYETLQRAHKRLITLCGCWMHARRRFSDAWKVIRRDIKKGLKKGISTQEEIEARPERVALQLIAEIYHADEALKPLPAEVRAARRATEVLPKVEEFFQFVKTFDLNDKDLVKQFSNKFREALSYCLNHEEALRRFLSDGNIPIDNGAAERAIRPIALLRKNCLFSTSVEGARANAIVFSLIETAKANAADPRLYLQYLLTNMPAYIELHQGSLDDMLPWSEAYRQYERDTLERERNPNFQFLNAIGPPSEPVAQMLKMLEKKEAKEKAKREEEQLHSQAVA